MSERETVDADGATIRYRRHPHFGIQYGYPEDGVVGSWEAAATHELQQFTPAELRVIADLMEAE